MAITKANVVLPKEQGGGISVTNPQKALTFEEVNDMFSVQNELVDDTNANTSSILAETQRATLKEQELELSIDGISSGFVMDLPELGFSPTTQTEPTVDGFYTPLVEGTYANILDTNGDGMTYLPSTTDDSFDVTFVKSGGFWYKKRVSLGLQKATDGNVLENSTKFHNGNQIFDQVKSEITNTIQDSIFTLNGGTSNVPIVWENGALSNIDGSEVSTFESKRSYFLSLNGATFLNYTNLRDTNTTRSLLSLYTDANVFVTSIWSGNGNSTIVRTGQVDLSLYPTATKFRVATSSNPSHYTVVAVSTEVIGEFTAEKAKIVKNQNDIIGLGISFNKELENNVVTIAKFSKLYLKALENTDFKITSKNLLTQADSTYWSKGKISINTTITSGTNLNWTGSASVYMYNVPYIFSVIIIGGKFNQTVPFDLFNGGTKLTSFNILVNNDTKIYSKQITLTEGTKSLSLKAYFPNTTIFDNFEFSVQLEQGSHTEWSEPNSTVAQNITLDTDQIFRSEFPTVVTVYAEETSFEVDEFENFAELKAEIQNDKPISYKTVLASNSDFSHSMIYGQSLGSGVNGFPTVSTSNKASNVYRFKEGVRAWDALNLLSTTYRKAYLHRIGAPSYGEMWNDYLTKLNADDIALLDNVYADIAPIYESYPDYKLDGTELTKVLVDEVFGGATYKYFQNNGETPATGFSEALMSLIEVEDNLDVSTISNFNYLFSCPSHGSASFASLVPLNRGGTIHIDLDTIPTGDGSNMNYFETLMADVYHAKKYFDSIGKSYSVENILYYHEVTAYESTVIWGKRRLLQLFTLINDAVKSVTNQDNDIKFVLHGAIDSTGQQDIFYEIGIETTPTVYDAGEQTIIDTTYADWADIVEYDKNNVILGASTYPYYRNTDNIHLSARGSKRHGMSMAKSYKEWVNSDTKWLPIHPIQTKISPIKFGGLDMFSVEVKMHAETYPLVLDQDTDYATIKNPEAVARGDVDGFIFKEGASLKGKVVADNFIQSCEIVRGHTVKLIVLSDPTGMELHYAYDKVGNSLIPAGNTNNRKYGNLRDSRRDKTKVQLTDSEIYSVDNWCPSFKLEL
tara:strand:+ start:12491 stop:15736 length:3246 start_codon:yes stop_codon:yes gene_type:complete